MEGLRAIEGNLFMSENVLRCCRYNRLRLRIHWFKSSHFFRSIPLAHSLSREPSADRYIRLLASNPLPLLIDKIIREASCLGVSRELERDFPAASLPTDVNLQLAEADAKIAVELMRRRRCQDPIALASSSGFSVVGGPSWSSAAQMSDTKAKAAALHIDINPSGLDAQSLPPIAAAFLVKFDIRKGWEKTPRRFSECRIANDSSVTP